MKSVIYSKDAHSKMRKLPRDLSVRIRKQVCKYADNPPANQHMIKHVINTDKYRIRVGSWRIFFIETNDTVFVTHVAPRGGAYKS